MKTYYAYELLPIKPTYDGDDKISFIEPTVTGTTDGYTFYSSDVLNTLVDFKFNKYSMVGLLSSQDITDIITDTESNLDLTGPIFITSKPTTSKIITVDDNYDIVMVDPADASAKLFVFEHVKTVSNTKYYSVKYRDKQLTYQPAGDMIFDSKSADLSQSFRIVGSGDDFNMITEDGNELSFNGSKLFSISKDGSTYIPVGSWTTTIEGFNAENEWVRYDTFYAPAYSNNPSILDVDSDGSFFDVQTNYLITAPVENITYKSAYAEWALDVIPTKNYKTIGYDMSLISDESASGADLVKFREYRRLYSGGNQIDGYSNINLGFDSDYSNLIKFLPGVDTYFHAPRTTIEKSIQDSGFEYAGASVGNIPSRSDRIYKRLANYEDKVWWGGGSDKQIQNGTWLCAWLSGGDDGTSQWMERYYDPGKVNINDAFDYDTKRVSSDVIFTPNSNPIMDIVSTMTIEPGAYYKYYHLSNREESLQVKGGIALKYSDFTTEGVIVDESENGNNANIVNYNGTDNTKIATMDVGFNSTNQPALLLNGNAELVAPVNNTINPTGEFTIGSWFYNRDWSTGRSVTLYDNFFKGGIKAEYINHGLYYSYGIPNAEGHEILVIPSDVSNATDIIGVSDKLISGTIASSVVTLDGDIICAVNDGTDSIVLKFAPDGRVLESINFNKRLIDQIVVLDDNIAYVKSGTTIRKLNLVKFRIAPEAYDTIDNADYTIYVDENGSLSAGDYYDVDLFTDGTICHLTNEPNSKLYINGENNGISPFTGNTKGYENVVCSDSDFAVGTGYIQTGGKSYHFMDIIGKDGSWSWSSPLTNAEDNTVTNYGNVAFITKEIHDGILRDIIYWIPGNVIRRFYVNDKNVAVEIGLPIVRESGITGRTISDFSGYKLNKRIYKDQEESAYLKFSLILNNETTGLRRKTITKSVGDFIDNWYYFTLMKDDSTTNGKLKLYINGKEDLASSSDNEPGDVVFYTSGSTLTIGGASVGADSVAGGVLGLTDRTWTGGISEFVMYNVSLRDDDIETLYTSKFASGSTMSWTLEGGTKFFVEEIQSIFKFKKPGIKTKLINLIIKNIDIAESERSTYEAKIKESLSDLLPSNVKLRNIVWR